MDNAKNVLTEHLDILQNNSSFDFPHNWNLTNLKRQKGVKKGNSSYGHLPDASGREEGKGEESLKRS